MPIQFINGVECVDCPCCKGAGVLYVFDQRDLEREPSKHDCTHCMGKRYIAVDRPRQACLVSPEGPLRYFGEVPF